MAQNTEDVRRYRASLMLQEKVMGASYKDLAAKFSISLNTVERELRWGREQGLIQGHMDAIMVNLVPKALTAIQTALEANDSNVALEILKGMNILKKPGQIPAAPPAEEEDSLEVYMKVRKTHAAIPPPDSQSGPDQGSLPAAFYPPAIDPRPVVEGDIVASSEGTPAPLPGNREASGQAGERDGEE